MEKSVVLPYEMFNRLKNGNNQSVDPNPIQELEDELRNILSSKSTDVYEKHMLYTQLLKKFVDAVQLEKSEVILPINNTVTTLQNNTNSSISQQLPSSGSSNIVASSAQNMSNVSHKSPLSPSTANNTSTNDNVYNTLLSVLGRNSSKNASALYTYIKKLPHLTWDDNTGQVSINAKLIHGSNIVDIISDLSKTIPKGAKYKPPPSGTYEVLKYLKNGNIPKILVKNVSRFQHLNENDQHLSNQSTHSNQSVKTSKRRFSCSSDSDSGEDRKSPGICKKPCKLDRDKNHAWLRYS